MKTLKIFFTFIIALLFSACQELDIPELSDANTLSSITLTVVTEENMSSTGSRPEDTKIEFSGSIAANGIVTFAGINTLTEEEKQRARFTAIVPLTATIVEKDGAGNIIGNGVGGQRIISKRTYYFYVVAANGDEKRYVLTFN